MSEAPSFFSELKRRNVLRVAAFYAATGWLLVQVATQVFPFFDVPNGVVRGIVIVIVLGFPLALAFSWYYELTPQGLKRQSEVAREESITRQTGRQIDRLLIASLVLLAVFTLASRFIPQRIEGGVAQAAATAREAGAPVAVPATAPAKSIAVLPFENLSRDEDNAYFASGMQDEILTRLASIHDLKVISRTSTLQYASRPPNLKVVAEQLGVATVLEGSVQRHGEQVHITLQLIDARSDGHLWAQSYDRELKDIFAVERDVAQNVADALKAQLLPAEAARVAATPTQSPAAYDLYLRGIVHFNRAFDQDVLTATEMPQAIALFEQAFAADPAFALAEAQLGYAHMFMFFDAPDRSEKRLGAAKAAIDRALALQPELAEAHFALGVYHYWGRRDYAAALEQLQPAHRALPNNADVTTIIAAVARRQGNFEQAIAGFQQAALLDPRSSIPLDQLGYTYAGQRRYAEADRAFEQAIAAASDAVDERVTRAALGLCWRGDLAALRTALGALAPDSGAYSGNARNFWVVAWYSRDYAAAVRVAETDNAEAWSDQANAALPRLLHLAWSREAAGEKAKARESYATVEESVIAALAQRPDDAELHLALGLAEVGLGRTDRGLQESRRALELLPPSRDLLSGSAMLVWVAQTEVRAGAYDAAFDHLRDVLKLPSGVVISSAILKLDPIWDAIRSDPRFAQLLELGDGPVKVEPKP